jgi:hypothetical protein
MPDSGEKSDLSSKVKTGGGGRSELPPKFSRHREEDAPDWPGLENFPRREEIGEAKSWKNNDCLPDLGVLCTVLFILLYYILQGIESISANQTKKTNVLKPNSLKKLSCERYKL